MCSLELKAPSIRFHPSWALSKSLIIMEKGAGKRCISLMETPGSQSQVHVLCLKVNTHWSVLTSRDVAKMVGAGHGNRFPHWHAELQRRVGWRPAAGRLWPPSLILTLRLQKRGADLSQGPFFLNIRLKTMSWKLWCQLILSVIDPPLSDGPCTELRLQFSTGMNIKLFAFMRIHFTQLFSRLIISCLKTKQNKKKHTGGIKAIVYYYIVILTCWYINIFRFIEIPGTHPLPYYLHSCLVFLKVWILTYVS